MPAAPDGFDPKTWEARGALWDAKLGPIDATSSSMGSAITELQNHALHKNDFRIMNDRVAILEQGNVIHDDRIGMLETQMESMEKKLRNLNVKGGGADDVYKRIMFLGWRRIWASGSAPRACSISWRRISPTSRYATAP